MAETVTPSDEAASRNPAAATSGGGAGGIAAGAGAGAAPGGLRGGEGPLRRSPPRRRQLLRAVRQLLQLQPLVVSRCVTQPAPAQRTR